MGSEAFWRGFIGEMMAGMITWANKKDVKQLKIFSFENIYSQMKIKKRV